jgi:hypothetical protein
MSGRPTVAGAAGALTDVGTFYGMTRACCFPRTFSVISFFAPLIAFVAIIEVFLWLVSPLKLLPDAPPIAAKASDPSLPVDKFCDPGKGFDPLLNGVLANTFHFSVTHVALFVVCALAFVAAAASPRNVVEIHACPEAEGFGKFLIQFGAPRRDHSGAFLRHKLGWRRPRHYRNGYRIRREGRRGRR